MQLRTDVDLNLLVAMDRLLDTRSVTRAAEQLHLSVPATSHTLARIRTTFADPLLVRSGRALVLTPRAQELQGPVREIVDRIQGVLAPPGPFDPAQLVRTFTIRASDALVGTVGPRLAQAVSQTAPGVTLRFVGEGDRDDVEAVRDPSIDLNISARLPETPDIEQTALFVDRFVGVARQGHPLVAGRVTAKRFAAAHHAVTSRHSRFRGPVDEQLDGFGLRRHVGLVVPTFYAAVFAALRSDLVATVPGRLADELCRSIAVVTFKVPLDLPTYAVVAARHRRLVADQAQDWLLTHVRAVIR